MAGNYIFFIILLIIAVAIIILYGISKVIRKKLHWDDGDKEKYYFAIHFKQILNRIEDYETAFYERPKPRYRLYQLYTLILIPLCIAIFIAYNILISISVIIIMGYGFCYIKFYKLWKLYGCSKLLFWISSICIFVISFIVAPYIRMGIMYVVDMMMNR